MTRLLFVVAVCLWLSPSAQANVASPKESPSITNPLEKELEGRPPKKSTPPKATPAKKSYRINDKTEIKLDGNVCKYKDVPPNAEIILLELASDQATILKIHFRTKKK